MTEINKDSAFFKYHFEEYKETKNPNSSRIWTDLKTEISTSKEYHGRELFELIQNAEDEGAEEVEIRLDTEHNALSVANKGQNCHPFTEKGYCSIMLAGNSPKGMSGRSEYIGNKGLGFRSLINWAETIRIYSNDICCEFSQSIAERYWGVLKDSLPNEVWEEHEETVRNQGWDHHVAILAIPDVCDSPMDAFTTKIEVIYADGSEESIREQLRELDGKVLLFLKSIQAIHIIDGTDDYWIQRIEKQKDRCIVSCRNVEQEWLLHFEEGDVEITGTIEKNEAKTKRYEVAIAYKTTAPEGGDFVYTYFPTRVPLHLPCVVHATFDLNSSRNDINQIAVNDLVQGRLAHALCVFAERLALQKNGKAADWSIFDMIHITNSDDRRRFPVLCAELDRKLTDACIYPTNAGTYEKLGDVMRYSEALAGFFSSPDYAILEHISAKPHLLVGFTERGIEAMPADKLLMDLVNRISAADLSMDFRAHLITALFQTYQTYGNKHSFQSIPLFVDVDGNLIPTDMKAKFFTGNIIEHLPNMVCRGTIGDDLAKALVRRLEIMDGNPNRKVGDLLSTCFNVSYTDLNPLKTDIVRNSSKLDEEEFRQLMFALFAKKYMQAENVEFDTYFLRNPEFRIFAADGHMCYPTEVVLSNASMSDYPKKWLLMDDIPTWLDYFKKCAAEYTYDERLIEPNITKENLEKFLHDDIGVGFAIPANYVPIESTADDYLCKCDLLYGDELAKYYTSTLRSKHPNDFYNYCLLVKEDFLDYLQNVRNINLKDLLELFQKDPFTNGKRCRFDQSKLFYQYRTVYSEHVAVSYQHYTLRKHKLLEPLRSYVISDRVFLGEDSGDLQTLNGFAKDSESRRLLAQLGAKESLDYLSLDELYGILRDLPGKQMKKGVQSLYKILRDAIWKKNEEKNFKALANAFAVDGQVYAAPRGGELKPMPVAEVYYWDNDQLPQNILKDLPKLAMPGRSGENTVERIFGVKLSKNIVFQPTAKQLFNESLTEQLRARIDQRRKYILAYRFFAGREITEPEQQKAEANTLLNLRIEVYSQYSVLIDGKEVELQPGDMIVPDKESRTFHICCKKTNIEDAIHDPAFCENVTEALCIAFRLTGSEIANSFRSTLRYSEAENMYYVQKQLRSDALLEVEKALGLSEEEKAFWEKVGEYVGKNVDPDKLTMPTDGKKAYLQELIHGIELSDIHRDLTDYSDEEYYRLLVSLLPHRAEGATELSTNMLGKKDLGDFYGGLIKRKIEGRGVAFADWQYSLLQEDSDAPTTYSEKMNEYTEGEWIYPSIADIRNKVMKPEELTDWFEQKFKVQYRDAELDENAQSKGILPEYEEILRAAKITSSQINQDDLCYALFPGYEKEFKKIVEAVVGRETSVPQQSTEKRNTVLVWDANVTQPEICRNGGGGKGRSGNRNRSGYKSERRKIEAGKTAELKVLEELTTGEKKVAKAIGRSRNLDPVNGDDSLHYDILYYLDSQDVKDDKPRYLEVKAMGESHILMSAEEYVFGSDPQNAERYDFAIVQGDKVSIIHAPFAGKNPLRVETDTYMVPLKIN